ncbi:hypothetical protein PMAYCL1PPCAC_20201, partial [Pristionchus mayeri]
GQRDYYTGTNILFSHGTVDPWTYLTKQLSTEQHWSVVTVEVAGGTHCSDLHDVCDSSGNCSDERQRVQILTQENIDQWLNGPFPVPDSITITDNVGQRPVWYDRVVAAPLSIQQNQPDDVVKSRARRSVGTKTSEKKSVFGCGSGWNQFTGKSTMDRVPRPVKDDMSANVQTDTVDQPWNHFDTTDNRMFQQRFFQNDMYTAVAADGIKYKSAPNFLMIGGDGTESETWVTNEDLAWMKYAKNVSANVYFLEHRYYAASKLGTNDLQYLTSAQMLYDVARFISIVNRDRNQTGPWITFGGAYAGSLAAWSREWFPELILGAVGSSATVLAKTDFHEYLQVVESVLR